MPDETEQKLGDTPEVHTDSTHEFHKDLYRTLVLLALDVEFTGGTEQLYFVVEGLATAPGDPTEHSRYFYEQHTCPTNWIGQHSDGYGVVALCCEGDWDPHNVFRVVRAVWMPQKYVELKQLRHERGNNLPPNPEDVLAELFPETTKHREEEPNL